MVTAELGPPRGADPEQIGHIDVRSLYWKSLDLWEQVIGSRYEQTLPGGKSDARNTGAVASFVDTVPLLAHIGRRRRSAAD